MKLDRKTIFLILNGLIIVVAAGIVLASPTSRLSEDQQQLQQELERNEALLEQQHDQLVNANPIDTPAVSTLPTELPVPIESQTPLPTELPQQSILPTVEPTPSISVEQPPQVTAIGDSVMLGTVTQLQEVFPSIYIDAATSRQVWDADEIVTSLKDSNLLGEKVIIALGANGVFTKSVGQQLLDLIDLTTHTVYWILPYGDAIPYQAQVVDMVYQLQYDNPSLVVIDWPLIGYDHPEWFYDDNTHLNADGQQGYAQYLYDCIYGG